MDAPPPPPSDAAPADAGGRITPMMEQYIEIKTANPDSLLFYRMGDFYELFFEDAEIASQSLGIVLTKRGKHLGQDIPMCGVPVERADDYLHKLISLGHRVAVCEQTEDPAAARKRGPKSVVRRDVVRLVTPGTLTEDTLLEARANNFLLALARSRGSEAAADRFGLAWLDISTGDFHVTECAAEGLASTLARIAPTETLVAERPDEAEAFAAVLGELPAVTETTRDLFESATAERRLSAFFGVASTAGFGALSRLELTAAAACITYVERTQVGRKPSLAPPRRETSGAALLIDPASRANLELVRTLSGERGGSLLSAIDRTVTAAGSRLLAQRLAAPLTDLAAIAARHDAIAAFVGDAATREAVRGALKAAPDMVRPLARLSLGRGGPRDLAAIRDGLNAAEAVAQLLAPLADRAGEIGAAAAALRRPDGALAQLLGAALADELPLFKRDGGFIRAQHSAALDELRALRDESRRVVAAMQNRYAEETGIRTLKIRHNNVLGYFVEVSAQHAERLMAPPLNATFIHRQTLAGQVRFTSAALGETEAKIASAGERSLALELDLFEHLAATVLSAGEAIRAAADACAAMDVATALAQLAVERDYVRPEMEDGTAFLIEGGRHPVVEQFLARAAGPFVANGCDLSPSPGGPGGRICLLTGPNMAGKSTYLRQNALIAILAQAGSFVPARRACIGIVDRLFSRVGAADDIARGRSTFMVEMVETAAILNQAGPRALVILDEIGRGTATFDGLSIAWATIEHLHDTNRCRALFATHYHELTALAARLPRLFNATMRVKEWQSEVIFLHEVVPGAADRSYGIQVARLAGLPASVIRRARAVLAELEAEDRGRPRLPGFDELPLFAARPADPEPDALREALDQFDPDRLSPREALDALYRLRGLLKS